MESTTNSTLPRGIRNNNPLNLRRTKTAWMGLASPQQVSKWDKDFCQFVSMEWGIRAAAVTLRTYIQRYKLNTISSIITRWAPPSENKTQSYIDTVASHCLMSSVQPISWSNRATICKIMRAMAYVECGQWIPANIIEKGYELAVRTVG